MRALPLSVFLCASALACDLLPRGAPVRLAAQEQPAEDTTGGPCEGFRQPGCVHGECPEGQVCQRGPECVPSLCTCDPQTGQTVCSNDCGGGTCVPAASRCPPVVCRLLCPFGFATDERGCQICRCKPAPHCTCVSDDDCVKVEDFCCPCNLGGVERALTRDCADQLLPCPVPPEEVPCIAFNMCTTKVPRCVAGECVLEHSL